MEQDLGTTSTGGLHHTETTAHLNRIIVELENEDKDGGDGGDSNVEGEEIEIHEVVEENILSLEKEKDHAGVEES